MVTKEPSGGVRIGNVTGGILGSVIAGRDVSNVTVTLGGKQTTANKEPSIDEFKQLIMEIQKELAELTTKKDALKEVSPAAPSLAQGAKDSIDNVEQTVKDKPVIKPEEGEKVKKVLLDASGLIGIILDEAKSIANKAVDAGKAMKPVLDALGPLLDRISIAALWAAKLWSV